MLALILVGGKGTRLLLLTHTCARQLPLVANRPILFFVLERVEGTGINRPGVTISPQTGEGNQARVGTGRAWGLDVTYPFKNTLKDGRTRVQTAKPYLANNPFRMFPRKWLYRLSCG